MRKSGRKIREAKEFEKSYRVEYLSCVDKEIWWTVINARNELELKDLFDNKFYTAESKITDIKELDE